MAEEKDIIQKMGEFWDPYQEKKKLDAIRDTFQKAKHRQRVEQDIFSILDERKQVSKEEKELEGFLKFARGEEPPDSLKEIGRELI